MDEVKHLDTPTTIKILKWVLILIVAALGIRLAMDLWNLPSAFSLKLTGIEYAKLAFETMFDIAFIVFIIFILKFINQRNKWGRWGALAIVLFYMGRVNYPVTVMPSNATEELLTRYYTDVAISLIVWLLLLILALNLIFRKAIKAYFHSSSVSNES